MPSVPTPLLVPVLKLQVGTEARAFGYLLPQRALVKGDELMPHFGFPRAEGSSDPEGGAPMGLG